MTHTNETRRAGDAAGLRNDAFPGGNCSSEITQKPDVAQVKIELLCEEIGCLIGPMQAMLDAAIAMRDAGNIPGLVYGLRTLRTITAANSLNAVA
jgi:hypothetical protein